MANVGSFGVVDVSTIPTTPWTTTQDTYTYLVTFPISMGNVPQMVPIFNQLTSSTKGTAQVAVTTKTIGNVLGGSFTLSFQNQVTTPIPFDASETVMRTALESLSTIGTVAVTRSSVDNQLGYSWTVEFTSAMNSGDLPSMVYDKTGLLSSNPLATSSISVTASPDGNQIGGSFQLRVQQPNFGTPQQTASIAFNADAMTVTSALELLGNVPKGTISVSRTGPDNQRGYVWTLSFLDDYSHTWAGNVPSIDPDYSSLTGIGAQIAVSKLRTGTVKEVQKVQVLATGGNGQAAINPSTKIMFQYADQYSQPIALSPGASQPCKTAITEVQTITSTTVDTTQTQSQGDGQVSHQLQFRLQYGAEITPWIDANPASNPGSCSTVAATIKSSLVAFTFFYDLTVNFVSVSATYGCTWTVSFTSSIGDINQLKVQSRNTNTGAIGSLGYSSVAGDDTVSTATSTQGSKDAIKMALEAMSSIGAVTVSADTTTTTSTSLGECTWLVTFDTNAGSALNLLKVKVFDDPNTDIALSSFLSSFSSSSQFNPTDATKPVVTTTITRSISV